MKKLLLFITLIGCSILNAQDLRKHIPYKASVVGSINGEKILESITINELDNSEIGKKMLKELSIKSDGTISSFEDLGVEVKETTYFYYESTDSISYTTLMLPIKGALFIEGILKNENKEIIDNETYKIAKSGENNFIAWDNKKMIYITGDLNSSFVSDYDFSKIEAELFSKIEEETIEEIFEIPTQEMGYSDIPYLYEYNLNSYVNKYYSFSVELSNAAMYNDKEAIDAIENTAEELKNIIKEVDSIDKSEAAILTSFINNKSYFLKKSIENYKNIEDRERVNKIVDEVTFIGSDFKIIKGYNDVVHYESEIELANRFTIVKIKEIMHPVKKSILKNKKYMRQLDENAEVNVWNNNIGSFFTGVFSNLYSLIYYKLDNVQDGMSGYGQASANLYMEDTQARVNLDMTLSNDYAARIERMMDKEINSKFYKYINEDKFIGYATYCLNTKNALEEYPRLIAESYAPLFGKYISSEEIEIGADFFSLLFDEEAVSKVILGDAMFILSDITEQEVTYTDYEYDADYNYKEIEKTQIEKVPNFLFMASTEDTKLIDKVIAYLVKKGEVVKEKKYYEIVKAKGKDFPLGIYFAIKDGIFFVSTSKSEIKRIVTNKFVAKLSQKHKNIIESGAYSAYFSGTKFGQKFPFNRDAMNMSSEELGKVNYLIDNATDFYLKSSKIKKNKFSSEFIMEVPEGHGNSIKYLLDVVDYMVKDQ